MFFDTTCFDCQHKETVNFRVADLFNTEVDLILSDIEHINLANRYCQNCQAYIFIDFKTIFPTKKNKRTLSWAVRHRKKEQNKNHDNK